MIGGPHDTEDLAKVVAEEIADWNALNGRNTSLTMSPVHWKTHVSPTMSGQAQSIIDKSLTSQADDMIAIFGNHLGSPIDGAVSGTASEIQRFQSRGKQVQVYFSDAPVNRRDRQNPELDRLDEFRAWTRANGLYATYQSTDDFRSQVRRNLTLLGNRYVEARGENSAEYIMNRPMPDLLNIRQTILNRYRIDLKVARNLGGIDGYREAGRSIGTTRRAISEAMSVSNLESFPLIEKAILEILLTLHQLERFHFYQSTRDQFWEINDGLMAQLVSLLDALEKPGGSPDFVLPTLPHADFARTAVIRFARLDQAQASEGKIVFNLVFANDGQADAKMGAVVVRDDQGAFVQLRRPDTIKSGWDGNVEISMSRYRDVNGDDAEIQQSHTLEAEYRDKTGPHLVSFKYRVEGRGASLSIVPSGRVEPVHLSLS